MINNPAQERIDEHLDTADADPDRAALITALQTVAAARGFTIHIEPRAIDIENTPCPTAHASLSWIGRPVTDEVLTDLISFFQNADDLEELMNIYATDLFKFLSGDMIGESTVTLTITHVTEERMNSGNGGEQVKPCLHFKERNKLMVLNKTNASLIAREIGPDTDTWRGCRITLNAPVINAFGRQSRTIRITHVEPPAATGKGTARVVQSEPAPVHTAAPVAIADGLFGDDAGDGQTVSNGAYSD